VTKERIFKHGSIHECSGNFQASKSFNIWEGKHRCFYDRSKKLSASRLQEWAAFTLFSKLNEITPVLQMSVTNFQGSVKKNFPIKLKIKAVSL